MDVTARHIHEKQFHDAWRGYNQEEVDDFLDRVADQMGRLERENASLQERLRELDQMVAASRSTEDMLKKTLVTAQQAAEEAIATAKTKAEELVAEAEARAQRANDESRHRVAAAEEEVRRKTADLERQLLARRRETEQSIERLEGFETEIKRRLKAFLDQQLKSLETLVDKGSRPGSPATSAAPAPRQPQAAAAVPRPQVGPAARPAPSPTPAVGPATQVTAPQGAVATEEPAYVDLGQDRDDHSVEGSDADNGDVRKRPLRGIFRRDLPEEDWSEEDR